ncbi:YDG domain-containing protein [Aquabacterium sp.]|uniref:YDG domain-containing protein n=1 Tax=Aquabacterium sp. TaxID=1872578 RepID=UPI002BF7BE84|nr:YDG domain-containing protein [Aquabacterium sp.]HSW03792.1 YDG domain-containing protein [Aquabacterium sp.]
MGHGGVNTPLFACPFGILLQNSHHWSDIMRSRAWVSVATACSLRRRFAPHRLALALSACSLLTLSLQPALALAQTLPSGVSVVHGQAQVITSGNRMTVVNTPQTVLNWNSFSIGANNSVYFQQANTTSQVLNRVVGNDPSNIFGSLGSNGRVWLLNPNGVLFGQNARIDVAGLVTSTLRLNDSDWLGGRYRFTANGGSAEVVNRGELRTSFGGTIALIGTDVRNEGLVQTPGGQIILAAGQSVELVDTGAPNLGVRITAPAGSARNLGELNAAGGRIDIHAAAVNQQGIVSADALSTGAGGEVWIKASDSLALAAGSRTSADGGSGGSVRIESAAGRSTVEGSVSAQGRQGSGGQVLMLGREVGLMDGARVDVSGQAGGGEVLVGGGERGQDTRFANAQAVYFAPQASIIADALAQGDGGRIVLWSDKATRAFGVLSARAGASSGNGGHIETSGGWLDARPARVDTSAPRGTAGQWLLDPYDILISDGITDSNISASFTATGQPSRISAETLTAALQTSSVTVDTGGGSGNGSGNIDVTNAHISGKSVSLTLSADRNITITGSQINLAGELDPYSPNYGPPGPIRLNAGNGGSGTLTLNGSALSAGGIDVNADSVYLTNSFLTSTTSYPIILVGRGGSSPLNEFKNNNSNSLSASNFWMVYVEDITDPSSFVSGGLVSDYIVHDGANQPLPNGNVFLSRAQQFVTVAGTLTTRDYDGTTAGSDVNGFQISQPPGTTGIQLVCCASAHYVDKNAGVNKPTILDAVGARFFADETEILGATYVSNVTGTINRAVISGSAAAAVDKVYNASASAKVTMSSLSGLIGSETINVVPTAHFNNKNVGNNKPVTVTGYQVVDGSNGGLAMNYSFVAGEAPSLSASITPRPLSVIDLGIANKVYDATTVATLSGTPVTDAMPGDQVVVGGVTARFNDKNVGVAKPVLVSGISLSGADAGNYTLQASSIQLSADITPRPLDLSGVSVANKVYDGSTTAVLSGAPSLNALPGDEVSLRGSAGASFADKNVGTDKTIVLSGLSLGGKDAGNYSATSALSLTADITPKTVNVLGNIVSSKIYDGTVAATLSGQATIADTVPGDDVALGGTVLARFADKNVGSAKPVSLSGYALVGSDAGNYNLIAPTGLFADITPRDLVAGGLSVNSKVYDATTTATLSGSISFSVLPGDVVTTAGTPVVRFADKNVGQDKPVTVTGFALAGADAGNYTLGPATGLTADITPRPLSLSGLSALDKVYDATTVAQLSGTASFNALPGDSVSFTGALTGSFADKNVGQGKAVTLSGSTLSGADAGNYALQSATSLSANITPRPVALVGLAAVDKVYDATTAAVLTGIASLDSVAGDAISLNGNVSGSFADKNVGQGKAVTLTGYSLAGADAGNYSLQPAPALQASITPLSVALTGLSASDKVYDGSTAATLSGTAQIHTLAGDAVSLAGTGVGAFSDRNVGSSKPINFSGFTLTGADAANYSLTQSSVLFARITPAALQYVATPEVRNIGQSLDGLTGLVSGFVAGDTVSNATQGTAVFQTTAASTSPPGSYAVTGSGLSALNYVFSQASGNVQALTLVLDLTPVTSTLIGNDGVTGTTTAGPDFRPTTFTVSGSKVLADAGMLDISTSANGTGGGTGRGTGGGSGTGSGAGFGGGSAAGSAETQPSGDFGAVKLSSLSADELQGMLDARHLFKQNLLADAVVKLERNPALADLRECLTLQEAEQGLCLITSGLKERLGKERHTATPAGAATASPAAPEAPARPATAAPAEPRSASASAPLPSPAPDPVQQAALSPAPPAVQQADPARRRVLSASLPQIERKIALIVGVDRYADASIPSLNNAVRDAHAVAKVFESKLGYEAVVIDNASKPALVAALNRLALSVGPRDSVVVYYAGHGELVESTKLGYWLLSDSVAKQPETWLSNTDISRLIGQIGASQVALVSDSCYSGSLASEERIRPQTGTPNPQSFLDRKSVVVMSSGGNEPVFDEGKDGHSPFAYSLMNTLNQVSNWQAGGNVFERVRFAVARTLPQRPQYSASRAAGHQPGGDYLFEQRQLYLTR